MFSIIGVTWPGKTISLVTHYIVGDVKQRGRYLWVSGSEMNLPFYCGAVVGWCQRSHSVLRTVSAVQNWKLAGKAALSIDQSEASVGKCDLKLTNQGEPGKNWSLVDQPRLSINDLHLHFSRQRG